MKYRLELSEFRLFPIASKSRAILVTVAMLTLASCASQGAREAELATVEAERIAMEQEAAQVAVEQERARAAQLQRQREQAEAERARVQAQRDRQLAEAQARAERERQVAEAEEQRERLAAIAAVEAQRQEKLDRIAALEQQIASIQTDVVDEESRTASLAQAVEVAEELLVVLEDEQNKYENTDEAGNTLEPLAKDLIAELESRKDELLRQSNSQ